MSNPLISVIIPVYNTADYLEKSVGSVIAQDYTNLEIILVDDGSTDNSLEICNKLASEDDRIVVISKRNGGVSSARNSGIDAAHGEYIGFVDSDDHIDSDMYSFLIANLMESGAEISQCGMYENEPDCAVQKLFCDSREALGFLMLYSSTAASLCNKIYSSDLFSDIRLDGKYPVAEDILCNYQLLKRASKISICSDPKYHYAFRADSCINSDLKEKHFMVLDVFDHILSSESDADVSSLCRIGKVKASLDLIRRIFLSDTFNERYQELRSIVTDEMKSIVLKRRRAVKTKLKVQVLLIRFAPWLYRLLLKLKYKN